MRYYLIAGEASGDVHGANLILALKAIDDQSEFRVWGGDRMAEAGGDLVRHYRNTAFMGFVDVLTHLQSILSNLRYCKRDLEIWDPDAVIMIDYPGFNMRIAKWLKNQHLKAKSIYYISPQVWAWKAGRANKLRKMLDKMLVILPFEEEFYAKYKFKVDYVGHPLFDELEIQKPDSAFRSRHNLFGKPIIAILPGSRKQEIVSLLGPMLALSTTYPQYLFVVAGVSGVPEQIYHVKELSRENVTLVKNETNQLLSIADYAIVTSGTATLETALHGVPQIVCYKGSLVNYYIAKNLIDIKYISLVNLILNEPLVKELIQVQFTSENLKKEFELIQRPDRRESIKSGYDRLRKLLRGPGASKKAAEIIYTITQ